MTKEQLWDAALGELELTLSPANFTTWFKNTFVHDWGGPDVVVAVPSAFAKSWLENKYHEEITKALRNVSDDRTLTCSYKVTSKKEAEPAPAAPIAVEVSNQTTEEEVAMVVNKFGFNPNYNFETFVVGKKNELTYAACMAVADKPGRVYNPLFIYGGVGLGKTHLMQAVGQKALLDNKDVKILYTTCENFTNEYIKSITEGKSDDFKNKYRTVDILLIDDVQFLAGKEGTQEAFFHTFNALHQSGKQIVVTSDRPPKAIPTLENRLVSRFEWGMIVDVGFPDLETRIAILNTKCAEKKYTFSPEIINYIASTVKSNIRELEGALNRLVAHYQLTQSEPTLESTQSLLQSFAPATKKGAITAREILNTVGDYFGVAEEDILGKSRKKDLVTPRQIIMYLMREEMDASFPTIGAELGGRDHTTAMHACTKIKKAIDNNDKISQDIQVLRERIYQQTA